MITSLSSVENRSELETGDVDESPLEVLSRAATMVRQEDQQALIDDVTKHRPTMKWKRDRRRPPEYSRKSDPKIPDTLGTELSSGSINVVPSRKDITDQLHLAADTPLDMTVRQRGQPPSYAQTISNPRYRPNYRMTAPRSPPNAHLPVIVTNGGGRDELPAGISMCDPVIEEHFRRSLGQDYHTLFENNAASLEREMPVKKSSPKISTNMTEFMDDAGSTVDDHFAKALGDTWKQLNKKEELKNRENENTKLVTAKN